MRLHDAMRRCRKCGQVKPADEFYASFPARCKECVLAQRKAYYAANREACKSRTRAWLRAHLELKRDYQRRFRERHREAMRAYYRQWYAKKGRPDRRKLAQ
jgi:hypothetical protein